MLNKLPFLAIAALSSVLLVSGSPVHAAEGSQLSAEPVPYLSDDELAKRAAPLLEIGDPFLETGNLHKGYRLPGGAVWQPRLWIYGTGRSAVQYWKNEQDIEQSEWVNRLDLFANMQLTGTERVLFGLQPLHKDTDFTGRNIKGEQGMEFYNHRVRTFFFEGDLAELFPFLDREDFSSNDIGFSVGRQPLFFQDGFIVNDQLDAVGLTRNSVRFSGVPWLVNLRLTTVYAWDHINRDGLVEGDSDDKQAKLYGLFAQWDTVNSTINTDLVFVHSTDSESDDLWVLGIDSTRRYGRLNTTLRVLASHAPNRQTSQSDDGTLLFGEFSWAPERTHNHAYINTFIGFDHFRSAARDPLAGGPLGRAGILFAARALGNLPAPLSSRADKAAGIALGYQMFFSDSRRQLTAEIGGRFVDSDNQIMVAGNAVPEDDRYGFALRYQQALGNRFVALFDTFVTSDDDEEIVHGVSAELTVKF